MTIYDSKDSIPVTSPSLSKLFRSYKTYAIKQMMDTKPFMTLEKYYWDKRNNGDISSSRTYETYLRKLSLK